MSETPETIDSKYLTTREAARRARVCERTISDWRKRGILRTFRPAGVKRVLIDRDELDRLLADSVVVVELAG